MILSWRGSRPGSGWPSWAGSSSITSKIRIIKFCEPYSLSTLIRNVFNWRNVLHTVHDSQEVNKEIQDIIEAYNHVVQGIENKARADQSRAYGGIVRAGKGKLVESIVKEIVLIAWKRLNGDPKRLEFKSKKIKVPINRDYIEKIQNPEIKKYLSQNIEKCYYGQKSDIHVFIDGKFVLAIECKAYTENAMMKRILVDFTLLKKANPDLNCVLLQLESQLGGDYCELCKVTFGSFPTHTLLSHFDVDLHIITLLKGERKVDKPIHLKKFFKPLTKESLENAISEFERILEKYV